ncbi:DNA-3-methyladenine glycosylase 2 [Mycetocola zhadangensis]|uniref:DNA-3-methyladenine glycosylase II n=1 Tax=Mycetocola zhadangensis TaxID=1164595 RepID=A0A3L7ISK0_9MICO|nr:DNA-3-methyladenine glycosylase 2 [Mycetocola zhadangensis]RLQ81115.1 DNA-3-methyladenine glycosylase 2 family protein [Mycetocola zhadangensis]GGF04913.1 DNA-3-methyladenine glycosylase [Mycetocola zhadangensis]
MDFTERYTAIQAKDSRFDGQFITAVRTTGIYCRPSCPARTPKPQNVTFFPTSAAAHEAGYRACKRCLPEAVPGTPAWNLRNDLAGRAMRLIGDGVIEREGVPGLAGRLGYSSRHLTRVLTEELGAGPLALSRALRAQTARTLLTSTDLAVSDVAFAAGFASIRQFNDTITEVFQLTPLQIRSRQKHASPPVPGTLDLSLPFRAPLDAAGLFGWFVPRAVAGVELATAISYRRTVSLPGGPGSFEVRPEGTALRLRATLSSLGDLPVLVARVRRLFDLDADPVAIDAALGSDANLRANVEATRGIRLPGAIDPEEMLFRAIIGQQISVAAARTQLNRLTAAAGTPVDGPDGLSHLFPTAAQIVTHGRDAMVGPRAKIDTLLTVAEALATGEFSIGFGDDAVEQHRALTAFRGIGDWTAGYLSMRVLGNPDVFLPGDVAVRTGARELGLPAEVRALTREAERFAPWRSYLCMHLWRSAATATPVRRRSAPASSATPTSEEIV